jgi:hypothetical protein
MIKALACSVSDCDRRPPDCVLPGDIALTSCGLSAQEREAGTAAAVWNPVLPELGEPSVNGGDYVDLQLNRSPEPDACHPFSASSCHAAGSASRVQAVPFIDDLEFRGFAAPSIGRACRHEAARRVGDDCRPWLGSRQTSNTTGKAVQAGRPQYGYGADSPMGVSGPGLTGPGIARRRGMRNSSAATMSATIPTMSRISGKVVP